MVDLIGGFTPYTEKDAEKYKAEKESGAVLDYSSLTDKLLD